MKPKEKDLKVLQEEHREKLYSLIEKSSSLSNPEIICQSQALDKLIVSSMRMNKLKLDGS